MAAWLVPALKAVLPHVGSIIAAAAPVFTRNRPGSAPDSSDLLKQQIAELQGAAAQNAAHVKDLAAQLQTTVAALEEGALVAEAGLRRAFQLCALAIVLALAALLLALVVVLN